MAPGVAVRRTALLSLAYVPAIHVFGPAGKSVDARAFASPERLRPRRRDKPGHDGDPRPQLILRPAGCACPVPSQRLFERQGIPAFPPIVVMAQPLHPAHPVSDNSPTAGRMPFVLLLAGAGVG